MRKNKFRLLLVLFLLSLFYLTGCGKKEQTTGGDIKTDVKQDELKKDEQKKETKSNELGIVEGLPKDYPSDIPQPQNSKCLGYLNTSEGTVVTFESDDMAKDVLAQFKSGVEKNGYKKDEGEMMSDDGGLIMWRKDKKECSLMLARDKEKNKTSVVVTYR
ncbi:MAG: hypothetical protein ACRDFC_09790 [Ignavibacteria bacterium]